MDIKVVNNVPNISVTVDRERDGVTAIKVTENKRNMIGNVAPGSVKRIGDHVFIILEHTEHGTAVITKDFVKSMKFGSTGDYTTSDVRDYCIGDFYNEMTKAVGIENIVRHTVDLTADDGTGVKTIEDFVSVLNTERYRRYRKFLSAMGESWWTATRVTDEVSDYTGDVCCVNSDGVLSWGDGGWSNGVRPFLILDSSILID